MLQVGDKVLRKSGRLGAIPGVIERLSGAGKVYVRWEGALRPFSGGSADNHSFISVKSLQPYTVEVHEARQVQIRAARAAQAAASRADWDARWTNLQVGQQWAISCTCDGERPLLRYQTFIGQDAAGVRQFQCEQCGRVSTKAVL